MSSHILFDSLKSACRSSFLTDRQDIPAWLIIIRFLSSFRGEWRRKAHKSIQTLLRFFLQIETITKWKIFFIDQATDQLILLKSDLTNIAIIKEVVILLKIYFFFS